MNAIGLIALLCLELAPAGAPAKGSDKPVVTIVEFADFQCFVCARAAGVLDGILREHPNEVRIVFRQYPLVEIHAKAMLAARASLAAHAQGRFWPMHYQMFSRGNVTDESVMQWAHWIGLDMERFRRDLESEAIAEQVEIDIRAARELKVPGTPAIFVNGEAFRGSIVKLPDTVAAKIAAASRTATQLRP